MTERGRAVFHQLVQNYENRMKDGSLNAEIIDLRLKMKLPIKLNTANFLDKINQEKQLHSTDNSEDYVSPWRIISLSPTVTNITLTHGHQEHLFNCCVIFKGNENNENVVDYVIIRAANQDVIKYGDTYNPEYFHTFSDERNRQSWDEIIHRHRAIFPDLPLPSMPNNKYNQYPELPQQLPSTFEFFWGQADLTQIREEYKALDKAAHIAGIELLTSSEFKERYNRFPSEREACWNDTGKTYPTTPCSEEYLYQDRSVWDSAVIFHGLLTGNSFFTGCDIQKRINANFEFNAYCDGQDLKQLSSYYCSYTHANPNNEEDLFATKHEITRVLTTVTDLTSEQIEQMFEQLQEFDQPPNLLENFAEKVIELGKQNNDLPQALELVKKIAIKEKREDLIETFVKNPAKLSVERG